MALVLDGTTGIAGPATGLTGTAPSLTSGNVTNNANLTGVVTSVGNATSWAASTGSGSNVLATSPTLVTPNIGAATGSDLSYTGTLTGSTGVVNIGAGQVYKDASGNVGIGTTSPSQKLHVAGNARLGTGAWLGFPDSGSALARFSNGEFIATSGQQLQLCADNSDGTIAFCTTSTGSVSNERARIDSSGNLLMGTTTQRVAAKIGMDINPSINAGVVLYPTSNLGYDAMRMLSNSSAQVGSITVTTSTTSYVTSSDYRLKNTITPMTGALEKVALLKPCTYKWKVDGSDGQGFIAHELAEVEPGCVTGEKDAVDAEGKPKYQGIDTSFLVATLTAAIQELKAIIDTQATRITALEAK